MLRESPCPERPLVPDTWAGTNYLTDRPWTLHNERAPNDVVFFSPPPPQGPISLLSRASAREEEGSYG